MFFSSASTQLLWLHKLHLRVDAILSKRQVQKVEMSGADTKTSVVGLSTS
jgi:hypothetical protein